MCNPCVALRIGLGLTAPCSELRKAAVELIREYDVKELTPKVVAMAQSDPSPAVRTAAIQTLGVIGTADTTSILEGLARQHAPCSAIGGAARTAIEQIYGRLRLQPVAVTG